MNEWFEVQINIRERDGSDSWHTMRRSTGEFYRFDTEDEARKIARMCYPLADSTQVRVMRVSVVAGVRQA